MSKLGRKSVKRQNLVEFRPSPLAGDATLELGFQNPIRCPCYWFGNFGHQITRASVFFGAYPAAWLWLVRVHHPQWLLL